MSLICLNNYNDDMDFYKKKKKTLSIQKRLRQHNEIKRAGEKKINIGILSGIVIFRV